MSETVPQPTLDGLSARSRTLIEQTLDRDPSGVDNIDMIIDSLKLDLDGASVALLEETLDWLRDAGAYALSLALLEEAWNSDLPLDLLGRIAQDWVGTVLFGLSCACRNLPQVASWFMWMVQIKTITSTLFFQECFLCVVS